MEYGRQMQIDFFGDAPIPAPLNRAEDEAAREKGDQSADKEADERLFFVSLGSGSSGNCSYVGTVNGGIIIDVGVREDKVVKLLEENGVPMSKVKGVLLTHDHSDHVRYVYSLLRQHRHLHLFCTNRVLTGLLRRHSISKRIKEYHRPIFKEIPFHIGDFDVTAFDVPHDGTDNMGYCIEYHGRKFVIATDLGEIQERADFYMRQANYLVIEANYDATLLRLGTYPMHLKARITTSRGHMDNRDTARYLAEIAPLGLLSHVYLCHLSDDNNKPEIAYGDVRAAIEKSGVSVGDCSGSVETRDAQIQLMCLPRYSASPLQVFRY